MVGLPLAHLQGVNSPRLSWVFKLKHNLAVEPRTLWLETLSVKAEVHAIFSSARSSEASRLYLADKYSLEAAAYAQLRDFGSMLVDPHLIAGSQAVSQINRFLAGNYALRPSDRLHNLSYLLCSDPKSWKRYAKTLANSIKGGRSGRLWNEIIDVTAETVSPQLAELLPFVPREIVKGGGLQKFSRTYFGVVFCYLFLHQNGLVGEIPARVISLRAYSLAIAFLLCDCAFDSGRISSFRGKIFFNDMMRAVLRPNDREALVTVPSQVYNIAVRQWDCGLRSIQNDAIVEGLADLVEVQFDPRRNARLRSDSSFGDLLSSSGRQACASREVVLLMCGARPKEMSNLGAAGLANQLSNDIEGAIDDQDVCQTIFNLKRPHLNAWEVYHSACCEVINASDGNMRHLATRAMAFRTLEVVRELALKHGSGIVFDALSVWASGNDAIFPISELRELAANPLLGFRLHRENLVVNNCARGFAKYRHDQRQKISLGERILITTQERHSFYLAENLSRFPGSKVGQYALNCGGRRYRSLLFLTALDSLQPGRSSSGPAILVAQAIEYFQTASLIFDDLPAQDDDDFRRGKPSAHVAFSEAEAQLAGLDLVAEGFGALASAEEAFGVTGLVGLASRMVSGKVGAIRGQLSDLEASRIGYRSRFSYLRTIIRKTGLGFQFPIEVACILAKVAPVETRNLAIVGRYIGTLYQIRDDMSDLDTKILQPSDLLDVEEIVVERVSSVIENLTNLRLRVFLGYLVDMLGRNVPLGENLNETLVSEWNRRATSEVA